MTENNKNSASYEGKEFIIDGEPTFIFSGEFHYYRTPHELWDDRLIKCNRLLLNTVASYIPWNWHERKSNEFDFSGDRDIALFIDQIKENKLLYIARPGPYICSEWDSGSVPQWIQKDTQFFRTTNPYFLKYVERWYDHINNILKPRLRSNKGNIVIYQIENEDWWCDTEYAQELFKYVRSDGIDCPIISNENPKNRGTEIIDTLDDYPLPWQPNSPYMFIPDGMEDKIRKLLKTQPDKPPMHTEFETGWYMEFGECAPSKWLGDVPAEWIEVLLKSVLAEGINALNMYMVAGGINYGYWGSRNCTTDRDWIAPIHGWGELNDSYYNVRRFGGLVRSLGPDLVRSEVDETLCKTTDEEVSIFARRGEKSVYICPRSLSGKSAELHFVVPNVPGYGTIEFPQEGSYHLNGQTMSVLPVNVKLHKEFPNLVYSTGEIFSIFETDDIVALIVSGDKGQKVEMAFDGEFQTSDGKLLASKNGWSILTINISSEPQVIRMLNSQKIVQIYFVDKYIAGRTWEYQWNGGSLPLVSNLYLLREDTQKANNLQLTAESRPNTTVSIKFPAANKPNSILVNNQKVGFDFDDDIKVASTNFYIEEKELYKRPLLKDWKMKTEDLISSDNKKWDKYQKWLGIEKHGEFEGGYYIFRTTFLAPQNKTPLSLKLSRFWDEASVYVNGKYIDSERYNLTCDITDAVISGKQNDLLIIVENWGHWEHGFAEETGLVGPVIVSREEQVIDLINWKRFAVETYEEPWLLDTPQPESMPNFNDMDWKDVVIKKNWDSRIHGTWRGKEYSWYRSKVDVPSSFNGKHIRIDFGECRDECWVYINGKFVKWFNWFRVAGEPFSVDVTDFITPGQENTVAILVLVKWHGQGGLHQKMQLTACENLVNGDWRFSKGLPGENQGYFSSDFDDSTWQKCELGDKLNTQDPHGILWMRTKFDLDLPGEWVMPMGLNIQGFEKKVNLYVNGYFLGRYRSEGPQEKFYIAEPWLKEKDNVLTLMIDGWKPGLKIGAIELESFPITKKINIEVNL